jgi:ABC-2 type transport system permease protein
MDEEGEMPCFLCGLFFPIEHLPVVLRPLAYVLALIYGADILPHAVHAERIMPLALDFRALA